MDWWEGLDAGVRDQLSAIMADVTQTRNGEAFGVNEAAKQSVIDAGGVVRSLTAEQRQAWVDAMKPVWSQFEADVGADNIAIAQEINAQH